MSWITTSLSTCVHPDRAHWLPSLALANNLPPQRLAFVLIDTNTKFWHKNAKGDFVMSASGAPGAPSRPTNNVVQMTSGPRATVEPPAELLQVWAYLRWEEKGKPDMSPSERFDAGRTLPLPRAACLCCLMPNPERSASCVQRFQFRFATCGADT